MIERKSKVAYKEIVQRANDTSNTRGFHSAILKKIETGQATVIAEIKKASPSKGIIRKYFDPESITKSYETAGATCISVLTDIDFFQGSDQCLQRAKQVCKIPVLRKDFIIDPYQVHESKLIGADCILLIVSALSDTQMQELAGIALETGMDILVEVHDREELERAMMLRTPLIGINNRNLNTFETTLDTTLGLLPDVLEDRTVVTESGIHTRDDVELMQRNGVHAFLVGEAFMAADDPGEKLKELFA